MTAVPRRVLAVLVTALLGGPLSACGGGQEAESRPNWSEPASYAYTLNSGMGERALIGRFRITVENHEVAHARGLDDSGRRLVANSPGQVPTLGDLLKELDRARGEGADTAEAEYAPDGRPERITLDWDTNALDDETEYVISGYEPMTG
ncbi:DUF6174 domain-containing protein [Streptomyces sp. NPDC058739]|uniref:DUF6174 domain-containing protein n=1 Tax=Streptomyces sp. NPDC058739 TaxID=3346618 RepID=UPI0036CCAD99